jgi:polyisoprenoid-binding protein YceI
MKKILIMTLVLMLAKAATAQYKPVDAGSALKFTIGNFGFDVNGTFSGFMGTITFDPQTPTTASFDVTIDAATVNTDNQLRDSHLKGADYFDVADYARIRLVSGKITGSKTATSLRGR